MPCCGGRRRSCCLRLYPWWYCVLLLSFFWCHFLTIPTSASCASPYMTPVYTDSRQYPQSKSFEWPSWMPRTTSTPPSPCDFTRHCTAGPKAPTSEPSSVPAPSTADRATAAAATTPPDPSSVPVPPTPDCPRKCPCVSGRS